jgi:hypothetical protein
MDLGFPLYSMANRIDDIVDTNGFKGLIIFNKNGKSSTILIGIVYILF